MTVQNPVVQSTLSHSQSSLSHSQSTLAHSPSQSFHTDLSHMMNNLNISDPLPNLPSNNLSHSAPSLSQIESFKLRFDFWENNTKIIVAIDIPGIEIEFVDIVVSRYAITLSRKIGLFEEKYFASKYSPTQIHRYDKAKFSQIITENIALPCAVQPIKKQAFNQAGTLFLTIEKLPEPTIGMVKKGDFAANPNIF